MRTDSPFHDRYHIVYFSSCFTLGTLQLWSNYKTYLTHCPPVSYSLTIPTPLPTNRTSSYSFWSASTAHVAVTIKFIAAGGYSHHRWPLKGSPWSRHSIFTSPDVVADRCAGPVRRISSLDLQLLGRLSRFGRGPNRMLEGAWVRILFLLPLLRSAAASDGSSDIASHGKFTADTNNGVAAISREVGRGRWKLRFAFSLQMPPSLSPRIAMCLSAVGLPADPVRWWSAICGGGVQSAGYMCCLPSLPGTPATVCCLASHGPGGAGVPHARCGRFLYALGHCSPAVALVRCRRLHVSTRASYPVSTLINQRESSTIISDSNSIYIEIELYSFSNSIFIWLISTIIILSPISNGVD